MTYTVRSPGRLTTPEQFSQIILRSNPDGSVVHLSDVARVELGALNYQQVGRVNGQPGVGVAVFQAPGSNALHVADGVREVMSQMRGRLPSGVDFIYTLDTTLPVSAGISEILKTLTEAMVLVIIVVFLFLQNWRATLIPMLAVPVSLIGTFAVFPLLGFSVNTLSLFGLVLAIGLVVDDAIVVVEAVEHHIEEGMSPRDATLQAMKEVSGPVVGIALILAAVFIPVGLMSGIQGRLNQQFAITIAVSVVISAFNALTLSPALSAMLLRPRKQSRGWLARFFAGVNRWLERTTQRLRQPEPRPDPQAAHRYRDAAALRRRRGRARQPPAEQLPARRGLRLLPDEHPAAAGGIARPHRCGRAQGGRHPQAHRGRRQLQHDRRFQPDHARHGEQQRLLLRAAQAVGRRVHAPALQARAIVNRLNGQLRTAVPEAAVFAIMPPSIPGLGSPGRVLDVAAGSRRQPD